VRLAALVLAVTLWAPVAGAQDAAEAMPHPDGRPGVWLDLDLGREALGCLDAREPTERRIRLLEADLRLRVEHLAAVEAERDDARRRAERVPMLRRRVRRLVWAASGLSAGFALALALGFAT
jgi:hypothetical protein